MLTETTHDLITGTVEYIAHLDDMRKKSLMEFYEYCYKLEKEKKYLETLQKDESDCAAMALI